MCDLPQKSHSEHRVGLGVEQTQDENISGHTRNVIHHGFGNASHDDKNIAMRGICRYYI